MILLILLEDKKYALIEEIRDDRLTCFVAGFKTDHLQWPGVIA